MSSATLRVLFATPECAPWVKTGGLGDVSAALPAALEALGLDVRVLLPAYRPVLAATAAHRRELASFPASAQFPAARLLEAPLPSGVPAWLVDCPALYERDGGPYQDPATGQDWPDNALRFAALARSAALLGGEASPAGWRPHVLHCNDWQTALAPAYQRFAGGAGAATVLCVHNLAFQGLVPPETVAAIELPPAAHSIDGGEFYGRFSFLKAGLAYADAIVTVSPTYAQEIQREPLGFGLQGLLAARAPDLHGILNGIDDGVWDPATDPLIARRYDAAHVAAKRENKLALQERLALALERDTPLLGFVGRLTEQKGVDLIAAAAPRIAAGGTQLAVLGTGERALEEALQALARAHPRRVAVRIGFDERLAHLIEAGADAFLMPSRFEPCGLNQMYSQRYGTPPVAHATGGLNDSIVDCTGATLADGTATGFLFGEPTAEGLAAAVERALAAYRHAATWQALQRNGMARDFGWSASAARYVELYRSLVPESPSRKNPRPRPSSRARRGA
jgi:starch synthase